MLRKDVLRLVRGGFGGAESQHFWPIPYGYFDWSKTTSYVEAFVTLKVTHFFWGPEVNSNLFIEGCLEVKLPTERCSRPMRRVRGSKEKRRRKKIREEQNQKKEDPSVQNVRDVAKQYVFPCFSQVLASRSPGRKVGYKAADAKRFGRWLTKICTRLWQENARERSSGSQSR